MRGTGYGSFSGRDCRRGIAGLRKQLKSPQHTIRTFLEAIDEKDLETAYKCLDLSGLDVETAAAKRQTYAAKLHLALTKYLTDFDLGAISDNELEEAPYPIRHPQLTGVQLVPTTEGLWKFSKSTVKLLDGEKFDFLVADTRLVQQEAQEAAWSIPLWLQRQFDESWWGTTFLLKDYQWVCLLILLGGGLLVGQASRLLFDYLTRIWFHLTATDVDDRPRKQLWTPVVALINIWIWYYGGSADRFAIRDHGHHLADLKVFYSGLGGLGRHSGPSICCQNYLTKKAKLTASRYDDSLVPLLCSALKLVAIILGVIPICRLF